MRYLLLLIIFFTLGTQAQCVSYFIGVKGDTLNCIDKANKKQGKWINRYNELRGEPGYEEEGEYVNDKKEGIWRLYNLQGDLLGIENYKWGNKDGIQQYYSMMGELVLEESWRAINPEYPYDTVKVFNLNNPDEFEMKIVKLDGSSLKNGTWKYYKDGVLVKTETYQMDQLVQPEKENVFTDNKPKKVEKPAAVLDYEKKYKNKKNVKYKDGSVVN
jgi:hypothetical protein